MIRFDRRLSEAGIVFGAARWEGFHRNVNLSEGMAGVDITFTAISET